MLQPLPDLLDRIEIALVAANGVGRGRAVDLRLDDHGERRARGELELLAATIEPLRELLADRAWIMGDEYSVADIAVFPWYGGMVKGWLYSAGEFLSVHEYKNVLRWAVQTEARYIGMIGSKRKVLNVIRELEKEGAPREAFERLMRAALGQKADGST